MKKYAKKCNGNFLDKWLDCDCDDPIPQPQPEPVEADCCPPVVPATSYNLKLPFIDGITEDDFHDLFDEIVEDTENVPQIIKVIKRVEDNCGIITIWWLLTEDSPDLQWLLDVIAEAQAAHGFLP